MFLNAVIVYQIHWVLRQSHHCIRVPPPTIRQVCRQAALIYAFASLGFAWAFLLYYRGLIYFSLDQVVNIWIGTRVILVAPPLIYVTYVYIDVWYRKLLPKSGRTRVLSLYFLRVIIVFLVTWVPYFILYEIAWNVTHSRWMVIVSYYLGSIQGTLSVVVALSKPDIQRAVRRFVKCEWYHHHDDHHHQHHSSEPDRHTDTLSAERSNSQFRPTMTMNTVSRSVFGTTAHAAGAAEHHSTDSVDEEQQDVVDQEHAQNPRVSEWHQEDVWERKEGDYKSILVPGGDAKHDDAISENIGVVETDDEIVYDTDHEDEPSLRQSSMTAPPTTSSSEGTTTTPADLLQDEVQRSQQEQD